MAKAGERPERPYHHGDLRRVIMNAALVEITERGPLTLSLRELARRADVSHAAPAYHFGDKAGLLTAIATEGFELLGQALVDAIRDARKRAGFLEAGLAYIRFALSHPAHFDVMFRPDLYRGDDPKLTAARTATTRLLYGPAADTFPDSDALKTGLAGWAFAHGFASLWVSGNLQRRVGDDPIAAARAVASTLFQAH